MKSTELSQQLNRSTFHLQHLKPKTTIPNPTTLTTHPTQSLKQLLNHKAPLLRASRLAADTRIPPRRLVVAVAVADIAAIAVGIAVPLQQAVREAGHALRDDQAVQVARQALLEARHGLGGDLAAVGAADGEGGWLGVRGVWEVDLRWHVNWDSGTEGNGGFGFGLGWGAARRLTLGASFRWPGSQEMWPSSWPWQVMLRKPPT